MKKKRIAILGATGSIGKSSLDVISRDRENFEVVLLTAFSNNQKLEDLSRQFPDAACVLACESDKKIPDSIYELKPDIIINGISGAAGLKPSLAAINSGSDLALANKETIVMAGQLAMSLAKEKNVNIIPVDSEHSAIFHLIRGFSKEKINEIVLTASGGPFKDLHVNEMENVTVEDALAHPTWNMGRKITIDSASMANKGLEIIEACVLFNMPPDKIKVVIHPQSVVHSMISLCNGVFYAQLSKPDMRHPIHDAIYWPLTASSSLEPVNFDCLTLEFSKPDRIKFPMLTLAQNAALQGALYPCAYNAANEIAVSAFLNKKIKFTDIPKIAENVLQDDWSGDCMNLDTILEADFLSRLKANSLL